jgi:hypothetical protein
MSGHRSEEQIDDPHYADEHSLNEKWRVTALIIQQDAAARPVLWQRWDTPTHLQSFEHQIADLDRKVMRLAAIMLKYDDLLHSARGLTIEIRASDYRMSRQALARSLH